MPGQEDERTAALCRQAALPMLRQRHLTIVPEKPASEAAPEPAPPDPRASSATTTGPPDGIFSAIFWIARPR